MAKELMCVEFQTLVLHTTWFSLFNASAQIAVQIPWPSRLKCLSQMEESLWKKVFLRDYSPPWSHAAFIWTTVLMDAASAGLVVVPVQAVGQNSKVYWVAQCSSAQQWSSALLYLASSTVVKRPAWCTKVLGLNLAFSLPHVTCLIHCCGMKLRLFNQ